MTSDDANQEDGGEGYFASISDLMVGILFVFLLMLTVFALNYAQPTEDKDAHIRRLTEQRDAAREEAREANRRARSAEARLAEAEKLLDALSARLASLEAERQELRRDLDLARVEIARLSRLIRVMETEIARLQLLTDPRERQLLAALIAELENVEQQLSELSDESGHLQQMRRDLLDRLRQALAERRVPVETGHDVLRLTSEALFGLNRATFTPEGAKQIGSLLDELTSQLPCFAAGSQSAPGCPQRRAIFETILIEGHTDAIPADNWRLSTDRALAVLELIERGYPVLAGLRNGSQQPLLGLAGYGESRTLAGLDGKDARNRRIEVRFLLSTLQEADLADLRRSVERVRLRLREFQKR